MFELFTDRARRVLVLSQEESRLLNHSFIGTEHILLGLIQEEHGIAARTLRNLGITLEGARAKVVETIGLSGTAPTGSPPFTPRARRVLDLAQGATERLGREFIDTEHMLLGLVEEGHGVGAQTLVALGLDLGQVEASVIERISTGRGPRPVSPRSRSVTSLRSSQSQTFRSEPGFGFLDDDSRRVLAFATEEAKLLGHSFIGTEHLLLGLLRDDDGIALSALTDLGITLEAARQRVQDVIGLSGSAPTGSPPLTPRSRKVLELSLREARQFERHNIAPEHILLGLVREGSGVASQVLVALGADLARVRQQVIRRIPNGEPGA